jgi:hypothetical protein
MLATEMIVEMSDHGFSDLTDLRALSFLNDTYYEFCSLEVWPFLETTNASVLTVVGNPILTNMPADWRAVLNILNTTTGNFLSPERRETIEKRFSIYMLTRGEPVWYYRLGNTIKLYNVPDAVYTLSVDYVKRPAALTTPTTGGSDSSPIFPVDHHRLLVLGALAKANAMEDDPTTAQYFDGLYQAKIQKVRADLWGWQYDRPDRIIDIFENDAFDY